MKKQLSQKKAIAITLMVVIFLSLSSICTFLSAQSLYYSDIQTILGTYNCTGCHGSSSGLNVGSYNTLLAGGNQCGAAIIPFNANASPLVTKIDPTIPNCSGNDMPPSGNSVSAPHLAAIKAWINGGALQSSSSPCADLSISAYVEGSSFNKCIEIFNGTGVAKDLSAYSIKVYSNGSSTVSANVPLTGSLANNSYYLVCHTDANLPGLTPNLFNSNLNFNGNDAVALHNGTLNIDVVGQIGTDPGLDGWLTAAGCGTKNLTMVKTNNGAACPYNNFLGDSDFAAAIDGIYTCYPEDDVTMLGSYIPPVGGCPTLSYPTGATQNITICSGVETPLSVVAMGDYSDIIWQESGVIVGNGPSIPSSFENNGCTAIVFNIVVTALSSDSLCTTATLNYVITVLPEPGSSATLAYPDACSVCIENACAGATFSYTTSNGTTGVGSCYQALPGENVSVTFTISSECGITTLQSTELQCTPPQTGTIEGFTWFDTNNNSQYDIGTDLLLNNIAVSLMNADNDQIISQVTTDFTGQYIFDDVSVGNYYLVFAETSTVAPTIGVNDNGETANFALAGGQTITQNIGYTTIMAINNPSGGYIQMRLKNLWPNPANDKVTISFDNLSAEPILFQLHDLAGRCILQQTLTTIGIDVNYQFEANNLVEGLYLVSLKNNKNFVQQKLRIVK